MENSNLKWYVVYYTEVKGWAVMQGDFRDSWFKHKYEAEARCEYLQHLEEVSWW